ncbi:MAG TPA: hypothetical protein VMJ72_00510 [Candidatus Paceibacterota bacterium]|nr:hypothetical protein [Candidatus Paceibacterota bacterium]
MIWAFIAGMLVGGLVVRWMVLAAMRRALTRGRTDELYTSVRNAAVRHLETNGTLNAEQLTRLADTNRPMAVRWLDRMTRERIIRAHTHGTGTFFTKEEGIGRS